MLKKTKPWVQQELKQLLSLLFSPLVRSLFQRICFIFLSLLAGFLCLPVMYTALNGSSVEYTYFSELQHQPPIVSLFLSFPYLRSFERELDWFLFLLTTSGISYSWVASKPALASCRWMLGGRVQNHDRKHSSVVYYSATEYGWGFSHVDRLIFSYILSIILVNF